jgi:hypothetical protein
MARTAKYRTCDDLINNCEIRGDCFIWPHNEHSQTSPVISPYAPMTRAMLTNSVARILFTVIRHIPVHGRLVKWCKSPHCVNPYHYSEHRYIVAKRVRSGAVSSLLPEQEQRRDLFPSDEDIQAIKPRDADIMEILLRQASVNPYDSKNLPADLRVEKIVPDASKHTIKPVLVMRGVTKDLITKKPEATDEDVDDLFNGSIFKAIEERKRRLLSKSADDWDLGSK